VVNERETTVNRLKSRKAKIRMELLVKTKGTTESHTKVWLFQISKKD